MVMADAALPYAQVGNEQAESPEEIVHILMRFMAGMCDGARTHDGTGFNRLHARFGHEIAEIPFEELTPRQLWASRRILETYKNTQIRDYWPLVPEIPEPLDPYQAARRREYESFRKQTQPDYVAPPDVRRAAMFTSGETTWVELFQSYDAGLIETIKEIPGRRYVESDGKKSWRVPIEPHNVELLVSLLCDNGYDIPPRVQETLSEAVDQFAGRLALSHASDVVDYDIDLPDGLHLYGFQKAGVKFAIEAVNVMFADQMGLGKTPQAIVAIKQAAATPAVVICPASLKRNWEREVKKWMPGARVAVLDGKIVAPLRWYDSGVAAFDVVILNYDILEKWKDYLIEYLDGEYVEDGSGRQVNSNRGVGAIILDEAHAVKNPDAKRTKLVKEIVKACSNARRLLLTGTPVVNRPNEFWTLIDILGYARYMGGFAEYNRRYNVPNRVALEELNGRVRQKFFIRRLKKDVLKELPDKQYVIVPLDISNRKEYEKAEQDIAAYFATKKTATEDIADEKVNIMVQAMVQGLSGDEATAWVEARIAELKRSIYAQHYGVAARSEQLLRWEALKQLAVKGKLKACFDWIDEFLESGEKLVVFATHTDVIKAISDRYSAPMIRGDISSDRRDVYVQRFQNDDTCRVIVGNIKAMGEGLTLTAASDVVFIEFGWNPKDHDQAEDRCHRIGQKDNVTVWNLAAADTIDYEIADMIARKRQITDAIQDGAGHDKQAEMMEELRAVVMNRIASRTTKGLPVATQ